MSSRDGDTTLPLAGSLIIVNGTNQTIQHTIRGAAQEQFGIGGVIILENNNLLVISDNASSNGLNANGKVSLINADSGSVIAEIVGNESNQNYAGKTVDSVVTMQNGNFVIATPSERVGGLADAGAIRLYNGSTGAQIGTGIFGDTEGDFMGNKGVQIFSYGTNTVVERFIISSTMDDVNGLVNAGSSILVDSDGNVVKTNVGPTAFYSLGQQGTVVNSQGVYAIATSNVEVDFVQNAGSIQFFSAVNGQPIGNAISSTKRNAYTGRHGTFATSNGNFVIVQANEDVNGVVRGGLLTIYDDNSGTATSSVIEGPFTDFFDNTSGNLGVNVIEISDSKVIIAVPSAPRDDGLEPNTGFVQIIESNPNDVIVPLL